MNMEYWKTLPGQTKLLLQIETEDSNQLINCMFSHLWFDPRDNDACIYCQTYNEVDDCYDYPSQFLDFYEGSFWFEQGECVSINIFREERTINYPTLYVPIDEKYIDFIKNNYNKLDICYDYMDQGWSQLDDSDNSFFIENGHVVLFTGEGLWINKTNIN